VTTGLPKIVVAEPYSETALERLRQVGNVVVLPESSPDALLAEIDTARALLVRAKAHVTARIIDAAPELKVIGRASPTVDHIDLRAARRKSISVVYSPNAAVESSAEFVVGLLLTHRRRIPFLDLQVRGGKFENLRRPMGYRLGLSTIGFLGMDAVGQRVAEVLHCGFEPKLMCLPLEDSTSLPDCVTEVDEATLLERSDVICVFAAMTRKYKHFINAERLARMRSSAMIINTSKGAIIDTTALAAALEARQIGGAALDVFENEPLPGNHPIRKAPNCLLTPHVAGATLDAVEGRYDVADDVIRILRGESPSYPADLPAD